MLSLCILTASLVLSLVLMSWALAVAARAAGSPRGRFFVALRCVLALVGLNVALTVTARVSGTVSPQAMIGVDLALIASQLVIAFILMRRAFNLPTAHTFAPFGAYVIVIVLQLALALAVLRPYATEAFVIPTGSMSPTIPPGGRILVNKLLHPRRWDVVAYWSNLDDPSIYCKRLVALPGERLRFDGGQVYINDQLAPAPPVIASRLHAAMPWCGPDGESRPGETRYHDGQTIKLGDDEYFFIGDNVAVSLDSRSAGPSKRSSLVGVADLLYWPLPRLRVLR